MWFADMDRAWLGYKGRVHVEHRKVAKGGGGGGGGEGGQIQGFGLSGGGGGGGQSTNARSTLSRGVWGHAPPPPENFKFRCSEIASGTI